MHDHTVFGAEFSCAAATVSNTDDGERDDYGYAPFLLHDRLRALLGGVGGGGL